MAGLINPAMTAQILGAQNAAAVFAGKPGWSVSGERHERIKKASRYLRRRMIRRIRAARAAVSQ